MINTHPAAKYLLALLVLLAASVACVDGADFTVLEGTPQPSATETLLPAYIETEQVAVSGARATTAYGQAQMSEQGVKASVVVLEITVAAATEQHSADQTGTAVAAIKSTEDAANTGATQTVEVSISTTQTAEARSTADAQAVDDAIRREAENKIIIANANAEVERIAEQRESEAQTMLWRTWAGRIAWGLLTFIALSALAMLVNTTYQFKNAIFTRLGIYHWGADGKPYMPVATKNGGVVVLDPSRQLGPALMVSADGEVTQPGIPDLAAQGRIASQAQLIELVLAAINHQQSGNAHKSPFRTAAAALGLSRRATEPIPAEVGVLEDGEEESVQLPPMAPWELFQNWRGAAIPLGVGKDGPVLVDPLATPHLLFAATSGAGKTMCGLRPIVATSLARGQRVILLNDAGGDFAPFAQHPNLVTTAENPLAITETLEAVAQEVTRRSEILRSAGVSTWSRLKGQKDESIMVVVDELVALAIQASPDIRRRLWAASIYITSKGRKMGIHFVAATTDPTYRTLKQEGLIVRDNCGRIGFRMRDASTSQAIFNTAGAESLAENQFLALLNGTVTRGVAFHPEDDDLAAYIEDNPVQALPEWEQEPIPVTPDQIWGADVIELAHKIEHLWRQKATGSEVARFLGKTYAGSYYTKINQAFRYLETSSTSTDLPVFAAE